MKVRADRAVNSAKAAHTTLMSFDDFVCHCFFGFLYHVMVFLRRCSRFSSARFALSDAAERGEQVFAHVLIAAASMSSPMALP